MISKIKLIGISTVISIIISTVQITAQANPYCNGQLEPNQDPDCGSPPLCVLESQIQYSHLGRKYGYCCYEPTPTSCVQVTGRYACTTNGWVVWCKHENVGALNCDYGDRKCFG